MSEGLIIQGMAPRYHLVVIKTSAVLQLDKYLLHSGVIQTSNYHVNLLPLELDLICVHAKLVCIEWNGNLTIMKNYHYLLLCLITSVSCLSCASNGQGNQRTMSDPNYVDGHYVNNHIQHPDKSIFAYLKLRWFGDDEWAEHEQAKDLIPQTSVDTQQLLNQQNQVTWMGHSTFLIQWQQKTILTDPVFSKRASPVSFAGPKRYTEVAMPLAELPDIDIVIISHNHYDHLDEASIKAIGNTAAYVVPSGLKDWFIDAGIESSRVIELQWWQQVSLLGFTITATPSQHWSARRLGDRFKSHWASWLITHQHSAVWFAGDTGYNDKDFVAIGQYITDRQLSVDLALIPIGAYAPRGFMKPYHVNTAEAVQIHKDIGAKYSIGMHWGAFPLTSEWPMEPYEWLNQLRADGELGNYPFETLKIGETKAVLQTPHEVFSAVHSSSPVE